MANIAFDLLVIALQRKLGLGVVEAGLCPFLRCVAGLAFLSVTARMRILRPVAIHASARKVLIALAGVANVALHILMRTLEGEFRL